MKKNIGALCLLCICLMSMLLAGCSQKALPSDEEILEHMQPYLENAVLQDASLYESTEAFLNANLGMGEDQLKNVVLYMGMPKQNTTFFLMADKGENYDETIVMEKLQSKMEGIQNTQEMGYIAGDTDYAIIEKPNKVFVIMHEDAQKFNEMKTYLNEL